MVTTRNFAAALLALSLSSPGAAEDLPPGALLSVGEHRLHMYCVGEGSPAVILDAGLGGSSADWALLQPLVGQFTTVCAYDRAGYGFSDASPNPRSTLNITEELHALLAAAPLQPPYVLVGHSFGGFNVRAFASQYPDEIAGLVLIDASHEAQFERFENEFGVNLAPRRRGQIRLSPPQVPQALPADVRAVAQRRALRASAMLAVRGEIENFRRSADEVSALDPLPQVPMVVLTRGQAQWRRGERGRRMERTWLDLQHALAGLSPDCEHIIATRSGHHIHLDQPRLVSDAVEQVVRRHRGAQMSWQLLAQHGARLY